MTTPRDRILASVRDGLVRADLPAGAGRSTAGAPAATPPAPLQEMAERFSAALAALSGHVHRADGASGIADAIAGIARTHQASSFISWDEDQLDCQGLLDALSSRGLARVTYDADGDLAGRGREVNSLAGVGLGVTGAFAALADTGGLVLVSGPGRGRLSSLLPPVHVAVVEARRLRPSLAALLAEEPGLLDAGSNVVVVAGPSRTADIEMTLTHGVHGPKHVHVI
ncbi:MAG: lactate utilization protein, partial [Vicinamibacterales bacterium]